MFTFLLPRPGAVYEPVEALASKTGFNILDRPTLWNYLCYVMKCYVLKHFLLAPEEKIGRSSGHVQNLALLQPNLTKTYSNLTQD